MVIANECEAIQPIGISCESTEKVLSHFTSHFSQTNPPQPSLEKGGRYGLQSAPLESEGKKQVPSLFKGRLGWVFDRCKAAFTLAEVFSKHRASQRLVAFTLAEVLITLGIIGVVAAITMPTLIANSQKKVYATKVKQTYSIVSQAYNRALAENGTDLLVSQSIDNTDPNYAKNFREIMKEIAQTYFKPHLETIDEGEANTYDYYLKLKNGITLTFMPDGSTYGDRFGFWSVNIVGSTNDNTGSMYVGTRDYSKRDFVMTISFSTKKLTFYGSNKTDADLKNNCNKNVQPHSRITCGALLQRNNFEITDEYPW